MRAGRVLGRARIALAGAAIAALCLPALALAQTPTLKEAPGTGFPDRFYLLQLPSQRTLETSQLTITENGEPVTALGVEPPDSGTSGVVLLLDASNSMKGQPIAGAMAAARAFMSKRVKDLPVAVVAFNPEQTELVQLTGDACHDALAEINHERTVRFSIRFS